MLTEQAQIILFKKFLYYELNQIYLLPIVAKNHMKNMVDIFQYMKRKCFQYFDQYDQIAIIDADVYIRPNSPDFFEELPKEYDFGGVVERSMPLTEAYQQKS